MKRHDFPGVHVDHREPAVFQRNFEIDSRLPGPVAARAPPGGPQRLGGRVQAMPQYLPGLVRAVEARDTGPRLTEGVERCKNLRMADKVRRAVVEGVALERVERAGETRNKIEPGVRTDRSRRGQTRSVKCNPGILNRALEQGLEQTFEQ